MFSTTYMLVLSTLVISIQNSELVVFTAKEPLIGLDRTCLVQLNNSVNVANEFIELPVGP